MLRGRMTGTGPKLVFSVARIAPLVLLELAKGKLAHAGRPAPAPETWHHLASQVSQDPGDMGCAPHCTTPDIGLECGQGSGQQGGQSAVGVSGVFQNPAALCKLRELLCPPPSCTVQVSTAVHTAQLTHTLRSLLAMLGGPSVGSCCPWITEHQMPSL